MVDRFVVRVFRIAMNRMNYKLFSRMRGAPGVARQADVRLMRATSSGRESNLNSGRITTHVHPHRLSVEISIAFGVGRRDPSRALQSSFVSVHERRSLTHVEHALVPRRFVGKFCPAEENTERACSNAWRQLRIQIGRRAAHLFTPSANPVTTGASSVKRFDNSNALGIVSTNGFSSSSARTHPCSNLTADPTARKSFTMLEKSNPPSTPPPLGPPRGARDHHSTSRFAQHDPRQRVHDRLFASIHQVR